jgi:hypothetical protein
MSQPNNNGHEKKKLVVIDPTSLPKSISLIWDYYKCNIDTDNLQTNGVLQVPIGTDVDKVRSSAMHAHAKVANDLQIEFDPFNATIAIHKIKLPLQDD